MKREGQGILNGTGGGGDTYTFDNQRIIAAAIPWVQADPTPLRTSPLRAPGDLARVFASESFMDELAAGQGEDAVEIPPALCRAKQARHRCAQRRRQAGELAGAPFTRARSDRQHCQWARHRRQRTAPTTVVAAIAEVEVDKSTGEVTVKKVSVAHDCGLIINPDG